LRNDGFKELFSIKIHR